MLTVIILAGCATKQPPKFRFPADTRVAVVNHLEPFAIHHNYSALRYDSFSKNISVNWNIPTYIETQLIQALHKDPRYTVIAVNPKEFKNQNSHIIKQISMSKEELVKEVSEKGINKNILKLSTITHPRGAFNAIFKDINDQRDIRYYKVLIPKSRKKDLTPDGITSSLLFRVFTVSELLKVLNKKTPNADPVSGLNLHYGGFSYYYPISDEVKEQEEEIAKAQRSEFLEEKEEK